MSKKISGAEFPLAKIFSSDFEYVIPSYQRPYAWAIDQAAELFDDLFDFHSSELEEGYFLGSIVLIKEESSQYAEVIDGQQRLTTLTILLSVLAATMKGSQRDTLCKYILEPGNEFEGLEPKPRLTLRERDKAFFLKYVQGLKFDELFLLDDRGLENESQLNIKRNSLLFRNKIQTVLQNDPNKIKLFVAFLLQRCFLVAVSTPSQQSAFRVFSVMNSRGLDLQPTDILKADVIGKLKTEADRDEYNDRWEDMEVELGRSGFNDLFNYIRMIYAKAKAKRTLLDEFREHVLSKVPHPETLVSDILEPYAAALAVVKQCRYEAVTKAEEVNSYLKWLNRIDNSDWIPVAICFLSSKKDDPLYVAWFFQRLERLAAFMHICAYNINERIERYNKVIAELGNNHSLASPIATIELTDVERQKMAAALNSDIYEMTARRRNYLILRLDAFLSDGAASYDPTVLTIEHVLPQTVDPSSEWATTWPDESLRKSWVHKIANLVPLTMRRNAKAQNFDFGKKKTAYFSGYHGVSSYVLTTQVLHTPEWTPPVLEKRQADLLNVLKDGWRL
ncbi:MULTISPECIES: DUF262 domain-containing protein [Acinetobacter calcoaceticus/baumannii complex]|uniref:DUF262 domain-containing protein n=1 Tax=Acinetobacter pittii TaxID=48296 RepID=A0A1U9S548_ACIPI|nr:DUF262 domain-containing protein [Acinetobacter pittii]AQV15320.1 hypothetical protein BMU11_07035 [Acinetobacter pittii]QIT19081.1 DUF262 domain-containing protein [Acinetobacter pittii]HCI7173205.1 DUF262 domain-containing protein [Acinetobacter baumannii]HCJ1341096.1 DUF262 domain-containing protein [Acinetobacter baumannii]